MTGPRILIPLLCYNYGRFLQDCLDSILNQTYNNWQVVVRDPQSSDNTEKVMLNYTKKDSRITYIKEYGQLSPAEARNKTIFENKDFEIIAYHDVDDIMMPRRLELSVNSLRSSDLVYGNAKNFGAVNSCVHSSPYVNFELLMAENRIYASSVCFRYKVWKMINGFDESENLFGSDDYDFWLRATKAGFKFKYIYQPIIRYRVHPASITKRFAQRQMLSSYNARNKHQKTPISAKTYILLYYYNFLFYSHNFFKYKKYCAQVS
jgi:glycosyltransferase involved in cell wall biosynthesis